MYEIQINHADAAQIRHLISKLVARYHSVRAPEFLARSTAFAHEFPLAMREQAAIFRSEEPAGVCLISGFEIANDEIGATPTHWADTNDSWGSSSSEFLFVLCAALLGDVFGWASQQAGRLVHEVVPIRGHERKQINSGSTVPLLWHTEDAFHPYRADYVGLMCLRNPDGVETTFASVRDVELPADIRKILFEPRFVLRPDEAHLPHHRTPGTDIAPDEAAASARGYARIEAMLAEPPTVPLLFGDPGSPYIRLDADAVDRPGRRRSHARPRHPD